MARVTVEDCLQQVDNQYDLVILAKERTLQLGVGDAPQVPVDNDKRTVLALREIAEKKVSVKDLEESTIDRMRDHPDDAVEQEDFDSPDGDSFEDLYQGEVSKSGQAILPSLNHSVLAISVPANLPATVILIPLAPNLRVDCIALFIAFLYAIRFSSCCATFSATK